MSEIRRDEIVYEDGWRDAGPEEAAEKPSDEQEPEKPSLIEKNSVRAKPLLTALQLFLSLAAALILFILKAMDSDAYHDFMKAYAEEMSKPVVSQKVFDAVDWNAIFGGGNVTVTATPDELSPR